MFFVQTLYRNSRLHKNRHSVGRFAQNLDCARNVLKVTSSGGDLIGSCGLENGAIVSTDVVYHK